jgi:Cohesin domain
VLKNDNAAPFDRVRVALRFDKRFMRPVRVFDGEVRPFVDGDPVFEISDRDNIIIYDARLAEPRMAKQMVVLTIVWEAVQRTEFAGLDFRFASGDTELAPHTAVYAQGRNILGKPDDPIDGVLGSSILVSRPQVENASIKPEILQGKKEELKELYLGALGAELNQTGIRLAGPEGPIAAGQMFDVDVELYNPRGTVLDQVRFAVKFDPEALQVVDRDRGNWIRTGVNVHDGPFRLEYPFDYHKRNEVDNRRGIITYANSLGEGRALRSGPFARIRFKAMKPIAATTIELIAQRQGAGFLTGTDYFGFPLLSFDKPFTEPEMTWRILPKDPKAIALIERPKAFVPLASAGTTTSGKQAISYPSPAELPAWYADPAIAQPEAK